MRLDGKVALIVGGGGGIGRAIAARYAEAGARIVIADLDAEAALAAASLLGGAARGVRLDVLDEADVRAGLADIVATDGALDVMVNCAGATLGIRSILDTSLADFERIQRLNVVGTFLCCREAARQMVPRGAGSIVTISSVTGRLAQKGGTSYGTSKAAVAHLTRIMAMDLAEHGVRVNAIAPGPVRTPLMESHGRARMEAYVARIPMGRVASTADIGGAALFLASDEAGFVTGEVLYVDGGFSVSGLR